MKELIEIQNNLKAPKNQFNNFGGYKYRSCEDILEGVKPLLREHNCILTLSDDVISVSDRIYIKATATIMNSKNEKVSNSGLAREALMQKGMNDSQITGSASSYARKYALNGLFAIDDSKEIDSQDNTTTTAIESIRKLLKAKKANEQDFLKYFKVSRVGELSYEQQQKALDMLNKK